MDSTIQDFVNSKRLAIVGYSRTKTKFGCIAYQELKQKNYEVYPVHPTEKEIDGVTCYPDLTSLKGKIDAVFVSTKPANVIPVLKEAAELGIKNIWLQKGAESEDALGLANKLGLNVVSKKCILMYADPVKGFHNVHRFFTKLFGAY